MDDNAFNLYSLGLLLESLGHQSVQAINGKFALEEISRNEDSKECSCRYSLIIMDCMMPMMDGYEACILQRKREQESGMKPYPIYALSADTTEANQDKCKRISFTEFLSKPVQQVDLKRALAKHL